MPHLSLEKCVELYTRLRTGETTRAAASRVGVHHLTAVRLNQHVTKYKTFHDLHWIGRPRILTNRNERQIVRMVMTGECSTAVDLAKKMKEIYGVDIAPHSVRRALYRNGLAARIKRKKPLLTKKHHQARMRWAHKYKNWIIDDWRKIV